MTCGFIVLLVGHVTIQLEFFGKHRTTMHSRSRCQIKINRNLQKRRKMMKEPFEHVEQSRYNGPENVMDQTYYQRLRGHYQTMMDHHQSLMEHHQFLLNHHQTVHALYRAVLDSQRRRRGPQLQLDWQTYRRALQNHRQLVEIHRQMLEEYHQMKQNRPHRQDL